MKPGSPPATKAPEGYDIEPRHEAAPTEEAPLLTRSRKSSSSSDSSKKSRRSHRSKDFEPIAATTLTDEPEALRGLSDHNATENYPTDVEHRLRLLLHSNIRRRKRRHPTGHQRRLVRAANPHNPPINMPQYPSLPPTMLPLFGVLSVGPSVGPFVDLFDHSAVASTSGRTASRALKMPKQPPPRRSARVAPHKISNASLVEFLSFLNAKRRPRARPLQLRGHRRRTVALEAAS
jgi:hypothetical protein